MQIQRPPSDQVFAPGGQLLGQEYAFAVVTPRIALSEKMGATCFFSD